MADDLQAFLVEQLGAQNRTFLKALEAVPEALFSREPAAGGHSAAWHALHVADWNRALLPDGLRDLPDEARFAYLGWEESEFARAAYGEPEVRDTDPKARVLEHVANELERGVRAVAGLEPGRLTNEARLRTVTGERGVLACVAAQLRHVPYHYGQVKLASMQLARETP
jgi:hypothetical protein